jgi:signal transduction histidine kinase
MKPESNAHERSRGQDLPSGSLRIGLWAAVLVGIVVVVNAAGIWEITTTWRGLREQRSRSLQLRTTARAGVIERDLASTTADLAFLVGSASFRVDEALAANAWLHEVGGALTLFLRGHPAVESLMVHGLDGRPAVEAGRPRGVPGYWLPGPAPAGTVPPDGPVRRAFAVPAFAGTIPGPSSLEAVLSTSVLLQESALEGSEFLACALTDSQGGSLAMEYSGTASSANDLFRADVASAGWGSEAYWQLRCRADESMRVADPEHLFARHRTLVVVNLTVMGLAISLAALGLHQVRQSRQFEEKFRAEEQIRELERQLFHAERLSTVGRLAASMAHEINNPLEGMANYLRLARDCLGSGEPGDAMPHLEAARDGLNRAAGIVRRVLNHADPAAAPAEDVNLPEVMSRSLEFVRSRTEFSSIRFVSRLGDAPMQVRGNEVMLGQVFLNLILNACEAQPRGGEVFVGCKVHGDHVEAEVADRGPGIPVSRRGRIFEPFESTKQSAGLGLSICHSIVRQHGGELSFREREGGGSVFRVQLRACRGRDDHEQG